MIKAWKHNVVSFHQGTIWIIHMEQKLIILQRSKNKQNRCTCKIKSAPTPEYLRRTGEVSTKTQNWCQITFPRGLSESQRWSRLGRDQAGIGRARSGGWTTGHAGAQGRAARHGLAGRGQEAWVEIPVPPPPPPSPDESTRNPQVLKHGFLKGNVEAVLPTS